MEMDLGFHSGTNSPYGKAIARRVKLLTFSLKNQDYNQALSGYDIIVDLMGKQHSNLKKQETLTKYINFLQSLRHK